MLEELKDKKIWVDYRKKDKMPVDSNTLKPAASNRPKTWSKYELAFLRAQADPSLGIGIMLGDGLIGIDNDGCRDPETGEISPIGMDIIWIADSYTEISPSGTGVHILCYGELPLGGRQIYIDHGDGQRAHLGMYGAGRYFTVTGDILDDGHSGIEERTAELAEIHRKYIARSAPVPVRQVNQAISELQLDDQELIRRACRAKNGALFRRLYAGEWQGLKPSQSEADFSLINILTFWCGRNDPERVARLFMQSGLMRPKFERRGMQDIERAISTFNGSTWPELIAAKGAASCKN